MKKIFAFLSAVVVTQSVLADMTCDTSFGDYVALYEIDSYTCNSGYYLPANTLGCVACPSGLTCDGGTFDFNPDNYQGLGFVSVSNSTMNNICAANFPSDLMAVYEQNEHTCTAGQYLPANVDTCTQCPSGSYCVGGTYTFNETTNQGIEHCATGYSSPAGSDAVSDCTANVITIIWDGADSADIAANNAGTVTYGGDIRTPKRAPHINGKIFTGWTFNEPN